MYLMVLILFCFFVVNATEFVLSRFSFEWSNFMKRNLVAELMCDYCFYVVANKTRAHRFVWFPGYVKIPRLAKHLISYLLLQNKMNNHLTTELRIKCNVCLPLHCRFWEGETVHLDYREKYELFCAPSAHQSTSGTLLWSCRALGLILPDWRSAR